MTAPDSFDNLMARLRQGDETASADIFRRYAQDLVRLAASRLVGAFRQKVDAEDVVQSAFRSFFRTNPGERFTLDGWDDLWALLATLTLRKCRYQVRHFSTGKRHVIREKTLADNDADDEALIASEPTPAEAAVLSETVERLLDSLDETGRLIAELALQGFSAAEIAPRAGVTIRSVYRQFERIRARLVELDAESLGEP